MPTSGHEHCPPRPIWDNGLAHHPDHYRALTSAALRHRHSPRAHVADRQNALLTLNFQFDTAANGQALKLLNVVDE